MKVNQLLLKTMESLKNHNLPTINASKLISHHLNIELNDFPTHLNEIIKFDINQFNFELQEHLIGKPMELIIGQIDSGYDIKLMINKNVLIPRDETYELIEKVLPLIKQNDHVLDLCTGSGLIGIHILKRTNANVTFSDISGDALAITKANLKLNNLVAKKIKKSDVFDKITRKYNFIIANPPYIDENNCQLPKSVVNYEPKLALYAKEKGLKVIYNIIRNYKIYVKKRHLIAIEFGENQKKQIKSFLLTQKIKNFEFYKDMNGKDRFLIINSLNADRKN